MQSPIQSYINHLHSRLGGIKSGEVASYIPELSKANPDWLGICIATVDGVAYAAGDADQLFTIQSISKPFVYATALEDRGKEFVGTRVGVEPSGDAFNSISLDPKTGAPLNPMINAGAIATAALVAGDTVEQQWERIRASMSAFMGRTAAMDEAVYRSESDTGFRNRAIAWMLKNFNIIDGDPMASLENYFRQCSVLVSCRDLAYMAATLANGGVNPVTGKVALQGENVELVLSVMATCGMYDYAGSWLYEVGMPAKSGVGGGIIAVVPGRFGIGIFSPPLDEKGNSVRGIEACRQLSRDFRLHAFTRTSNPLMALGRVYTGADAPSRRRPDLELRDCLKGKAHRIKYLCLQGYVAGDGADYVIRQMQQMAADSECFILDMHGMMGLSESAARLLNQARLGFAEEGIAVVCSRVHQRPAIIGPLSKAVAKDDRGFLVFEDNDRAVEWCENRLVGALCAPPVTRNLADSLLLQGLPDAVMRRVEGLARLKTFARGEQILRIGQQGDGQVFFIQSGQVSILVPLQDGAHQRIATLGPGMEFGELALIGQTTRSASVYADSDVVCRVLEVEQIELLSRDLPQLKITILENLARDLAQKLRGANHWIAALA